MRKCMVLFVMLLSVAVFSADKVKVLIIDGINNHNWKETTRATKGTLIASGRFSVDVSTSPGKKDGADAWNAWNPEFSKYDVVLSNLNDGGKTRFSETTKKNLVNFVKEGGGFVVVHAADNSCGDWPEYNEMIAVGGWGGRKPKTHGSLLRMTDGKWQADPAPKGKSGSHGPQHEFVVTHHEADHPILKGLPVKWMHGKDELYNSLRGPCKNVTVLASAVSKQTKVAEPMMMIIEFGKGKVFHTPMGHYGPASVHCVGFQTILARGTEFVATGKVTIPVPKAFPTETKSSVIEPDKVEWK